MKKLQFLPLMALVLGFGLTITMSSFKANRFTQTWVFISDDLNDAATANSSHYEMNPSTLPSGCGEATQLPCQIVTPTSVDTFGELQTYLNTNFDGADPETIREQADSRKSQP